MTALRKSRNFANFLTLLNYNSRIPFIDKMTMVEFLLFVNTGAFLIFSLPFCFRNNFTI